ncbi:MAG: hypothetical protein J6N19_15300 [Clostridium sp.]|nr:hypothetical protein [Clostridium sp.]
MRSMNGYVRLYRKLVEWGWYSDHVVKDVFLHLLMIAAWKDGAYMGHAIHPGDAIIGYQKLAKDLGFSTQQVRTAIKKLESTGEISKKSTNKFTIVTIENWAIYQGDDSDSNKRATNEQQTNNKRATNEQQHLKKVKKKEGKKENNMYVCAQPTPTHPRKMVPPTMEMLQEYAAERKRIGKPYVDVEKFYDFYESKGWKVGRERMKDWQAAYRNWERDRNFSGKQKPRNEVKQLLLEDMLSEQN